MLNAEHEQVAKLIENSKLTSRMKTIIILVFLLQQWTGRTSASTTLKSWTTPRDSETRNIAFATDGISELQYQGTTTLAASDSPKAGTSTLKESIQATQTLPVAQNIRALETHPLIPQATSVPVTARNRTKSSADGEQGVMISSPGKLSNSIPKNGLLQNGILKTLQAAAVNKAPTKTYQSSSSTQKTDSKKSSFETTRGKNWCAYVHTRLLPTVAMENMDTVSGTRPCMWTAGACSVRYQLVTRPAYRMKHKIVTSLEWKCCPGFHGDQCQFTALTHQWQMPGSQAESSVVDNGGTARQQQPRTADPALTQKLNEQIYNQEVKLTVLQKKLSNISSAMTDVWNTLSSLEGKISDDDNKEEEFQSFFKGLKSKSINELIKDIVKEQVQELQSDMQETVAQLFKTVSSLSVELESTKEETKQLNETVSLITENTKKSAIEEESRPTVTDILDLKNHIEEMRKEITRAYDSSLKELQENHKSLENDLEHERSRSSIYYESLNKTLSKMRELHEQLLSGENMQEEKGVATEKSENENVTEHIIALQDKIRKQSLLMLQLYEEVSAQDCKINNLTMTLELQKDSNQKACEDKFLLCKNDFEKQLKCTQENMRVFNKTLSDVVFPMDDKIDKMNDQINDLCYDMEILQPFIEQGAPFSGTADSEHQNEVARVNQQLENLTAIINSLSSNVKELTKEQEVLRDEVQSHDQKFERRINECLMETEDGLNSTLTVINNAVDFIQDNYVLKETIYNIKDNSELHNDTVKKLDMVLALIPQLIQLNESFQMLISKTMRNQNVLKTIEVLSNISYGEPENNLQKTGASAYQVLNEIISKVNQYHQTISLLEDKQINSSQNEKNYDFRLYNIETQLSQIMANPSFLAKTKVDCKNAGEKEQAISLKIQALNSRIKALEARSIKLANTMPLLNKTVHGTQGLCQNVYVAIQKVNASVPQQIKAAQPNATTLQNGLKEFIVSVTETRTETLLSNFTLYMDKSLSDIISNIAKLQRQMKATVRKPALPKMSPMNITTALQGRSQRNTDSNFDPDEYLGCSSSPCNNGGTCINDRKSFVCACRHPFGGANCSVKMEDENSLAPDFSKGSYRYAPMVTFFVSHTYGMTTPGPIRFNNLYVNYGASYAPQSGKFHVPYLGVYVFKYTIESFSPVVSGYLVVDGIDKLAFHSENINSNMYSDRVITGDALLELNYGQKVWLRLATGSIPAKFPPVTTFGGYLLYRT
ncbi:multimerin-1 [Rhinatrema bivittatum]|uniref:multimerin-1 n=1 Tax=Rhinatrema bivittatum TaxID=194408 RepID=UPI00112D0A46|nr:multimerin-1 [Rhinatrema bivittatum]